MTPIDKKDRADDPLFDLALCRRCGSDETFRLVTRIQLRNEDSAVFALCKACSEAMDNGQP